MDFRLYRAGNFVFDYFPNHSALLFIRLVEPQPDWLLLPVLLVY